MKNELTDWQKTALPNILETHKKARSLRDEIRRLDSGIVLDILSLSHAVNLHAQEVAEGIVNGYQASLTISELSDMVRLADELRRKLNPPIPDWAEPFTDEVKKDADA